MMEKLYALQIGWYTSLDEIEEDIRDAGFEVEDINREGIEVSYEEKEEDKTVYIYIQLGGTERTITVGDINEVGRF